MSWAMGFRGEEGDRMNLIEVIKALDGHDDDMLLQEAKWLKQRGGEGWAIGEMVERAVKARNMMKAEGIELPPVPGIPFKLEVSELSEKEVARDNLREAFVNSIDNLSPEGLQEAEEYRAKVSALPVEKQREIGQKINEYTKKIVAEVYERLANYGEGTKK